MRDTTRDPRNAEEILELASGRTGLDDFGPPEVIEGLNCYLESLPEASLHPLGLNIIEGFLVRSLMNRLHFQSLLGNGHSSPVIRPCMIIGLPRTATTLLYNLLACDPQFRHLRQEDVGPATPLSSTPEGDSPAAGYFQSLYIYHLAPDFRRIHHEELRSPSECTAIFAQDFHSQLYECLTNVPAYHEWFIRADFSGSYRYHREVLSLLSRDDEQWLLKSPQHSLFLRELLETYPDARLVSVHRDPGEVVASMCSLVAHFSGIYSDMDFRACIGPHWLEYLGKMADSLCASPDRMCHLRYDDLVRDPLVEIDRLYRAWDLTLTDEVRRRMQDHLVRHPAGEFGRHDYTLEAYGLREVEVRDRFSVYESLFLNRGL